MWELEGKLSVNARISRAFQVNKPTRTISVNNKQDDDTVVTDGERRQLFEYPARGGEKDIMTTPSYSNADLTELEHVLNCVLICAIYILWPLKTT